MSVFDLKRYTLCSSMLNTRPRVPNLPGAQFDGDSDVLVVNYFLKETVVPNHPTHADRRYFLVVWHVQKAQIGGRYLPPDSARPR
jgi:hypothetical protein